MYKQSLIRHLFVGACCFLMFGTRLDGQSFQTTIKNQGTTLIVKIRPTGGNITTGFANMEFYIRYPSTKSITWAAPVVNTTDFVGIDIQKNDPYTSVTESGYSIVRFFLPPGAFVGSKTFNNNTEYEVFRSTATTTSLSDIEMIHRNAEDPYVSTLVNETASTELTGTVKFYGAGASGAGVVQTLPLAVVIPLELLDFSGQAESAANKLTWETANEINTSHFSIEKAIGNSNKFVAIGEVKTSGITAATPQSYSFADAQVTNLDYYRLKIVDKDGQFTYSKTISLTRKSSISIDLYPNPATNTLNIALGNKYQVATITLSDAAGHIHAVQSKSKDKSDNAFFIFDTQYFANGVYTATVTIDGKSSLHKVVIAK